MALGSMDILTILTIPIHEHEMFFHLFVSSSISFITVLWFLVYRFFTSLVKFFHKYFTVFDVIVNGIVFFISFLDIFLLVYRKTSDFCLMIL